MMQAEINQLKTRKNIINFSDLGSIWGDYKPRSQEQPKRVQNMYWIEALPRKTKEVFLEELIGVHSTLACQNLAFLKT